MSPIMLGLGSGPVDASGGTEQEVTINGVLHRVHTFATGGSYTLSVSTGGEVEVWAIGGGAGGRNAGIQNVYNNGGGAGVIREDTIRIPAGDLTVTVGAGTAYNSASPGGDSTFESVTATGGHAPGSGTRYGGDNDDYSGDRVTGNNGGGGGAGAGGDASGNSGGASVSSDFDGTTRSYGKGGDGEPSAPPGTDGLGEGGGGSDPGGDGRVMIRYPIE